MKPTSWRGLGESGECGFVICALEKLWLAPPRPVPAGRASIRQPNSDVSSAEGMQEATAFLQAGWYTKKGTRSSPESKCDPSQSALWRPSPTPGPGQAPKTFLSSGEPQITGLGGRNTFWAWVIVQRRQFPTALPLISFPGPSERKSDTTHPFGDHLRPCSAHPSSTKLPTNRDQWRTPTLPPFLASFSPPRSIIIKQRVERPPCRIKYRCPALRLVLQFACATCPPRTVFLAYLQFK